MHTVGIKRERATIRAATPPPVFSAFQIQSSKTKRLQLSYAREDPGSAEPGQGPKGDEGHLVEDPSHRDRDSNGGPMAGETIKKKATKLEQTYLTGSQGARPCPQCGMVYIVGSPEDEKLHSVEHARVVLGTPFSGWKDEVVVASGSGPPKFAGVPGKLTNPHSSKQDFGAWKIIQLSVADALRRPKLLEVLDQTLGDLRSTGTSLALESGVSVVEETQLAEVSEARQMRMVAIAQAAMLQALGLPSYRTTQDSRTPGSILASLSENSAREDAVESKTNTFPHDLLEQTKAQWLQGADLARKFFRYNESPRLQSIAPQNPVAERVVEMLDVDVRTLERMQDPALSTLPSSPPSGANPNVISVPVPRLLPWPAWANGTCGRASTIYLFIANGRLKGLLIVRQLPIRLPQAAAWKQGEDLRKRRRVYACLGIDTLWTHPSARRLGVAQTLVDAARRTAFIPTPEDPAIESLRNRYPSGTKWGQVDHSFTVPKACVAFSEPTSMGAAFARSYTGTISPLVYSFGTPDDAGAPQDSEQVSDNDDEDSSDEEPSQGTLSQTPARVTSREADLTSTPKISLSLTLPLVPKPSTPGSARPTSTKAQSSSPRSGRSAHRSKSSADSDTLSSPLAVQRLISSFLNSPKTNKATPPRDKALEKLRQPHTYATPKRPVVGQSPTPPPRSTTSTTLSVPDCANRAASPTNESTHPSTLECMMHSTTPTYKSTTPISTSTLPILPELSQADQDDPFA